MKADFELRREGGIFLLRPLSQAARDWIHDNVDQEAQYFGEAVVIEHRFMRDIYLALRREGFAFK